VVSFSGDVLPIFQRRCVKCHGGERTEEGLILKTYADVMAGSWNGPVIEPGSAADSYLVEQIVSGEMPKKQPDLLPSEIRIISNWVDSGALDN
jgi:mono/diheme cytochrome c family protein